MNRIWWMLLSLVVWTLVTTVSLAWAQTQPPASAAKKAPGLQGGDERQHEAEAAQKKKDDLYGKQRDGYLRRNIEGYEDQCDQANDTYWRNVKGIWEAYGRWLKEKESHKKNPKMANVYKEEVASLQKERDRQLQKEFTVFDGRLKKNFESYNKELDRIMEEYNKNLSPARRDFSYHGVEYKGDHWVHKLVQRTLEQGKPKNWQPPTDNP